MKVNFRKIFVISIVFLIVLAMMLPVFAVVTSADITGKYSGSSGDALQGSKSVKNTIAGILDAVRIASAGVAIIMLTILGAKYMLSSPNDRAEIKKGAIVYVVGAVVMMSASFLAKVIKEFTTTNIKAS